MCGGRSAAPRHPAAAHLLEGDLLDRSQDFDVQLVDADFKVRDDVASLGEDRLAAYPLRVLAAISAFQIVVGVLRLPIPPSMHWLYG